MSENPLLTLDTQLIISVVYQSQLEVYIVFLNCFRRCFIQERTTLCLLLVWVKGVVVFGDFLVFVEFELLDWTLFFKTPYCISLLREEFVYDCAKSDKQPLGFQSLRYDTDWSISGKTSCCCSTTKS